MLRKEMPVARRQCASVLVARDGCLHTRARRPEFSEKQHMKQADIPLHPARMAAMLRAGVLAIVPGDIGLNANECPTVWGVMMELGIADVVASLVVLADGSVSVYLSDGEGVIGCGLHPDVRAAAAKMLQVAGRAEAQCVRVDTYPMPKTDQVRFYLLTTRGILGGEASRVELDDGAVDLAELYYAGHGVIGMVELLGAGVDLVDEMRLAEMASLNELSAGIEPRNESGQPGMQQFKARGRGCRILPYVGTVARRSQN